MPDSDVYKLPPNLSWALWPGRDMQCKMCDYQGRMPEVINIKYDFFYNDKKYDSFSLYRCPQCECLQPWPPHIQGEGGYENPDINIEDDFKAQSNAFMKYYLEEGADFSFLVAPLQCITNTYANPTMLDVGCGSGIAMLYAKNMLGANAVGFEPGFYGAAGKRFLGLNINNSYYEPNGNKYDIVYCSEVIEHVSNPKTFLYSLCESVSDKGTLILTTPLADNVKFPPELTATSIVETIYPPHNILQSLKSFRNILYKYQFNNISLFPFLNRVIVFASNIPSFDLSLFTKRDNYKNFLYSIIENDDNHSFIINSALFRLLKEYVNYNESEKALNILEKYEANLLADYGDASQVNKNLCNFFDSLHEYKADDVYKICNISPFNYPVFLYYKGMIQLKNRNFQEAIDNFYISSYICQLLCDINPYISGEYQNIVCVAKFHEGLSYEALNKTDEAKNCFKSIVEKNKFPFADSAIYKRALAKI